VRHLLSIRDLTPDQIRKILDLSKAASPPRALQDKGVALYFQKPSATPLS